MILEVLIPSRALIGKGEETVPGNRERIDEQNPDEQDHGCYKDRHHFHHRCLTENGAPDRIVLEHGDRDTPPGKHGVESGSQEPGSQQVPDFGRFIAALFGGKDAGDAGKINPTEGKG